MVTNDSRPVQPVVLPHSLASTPDAASALPRDPAQAPARSDDRRSRALAGVIALLALTSIHHVYGAIRYSTPWRYHAVFVSAVLLVVIVGALRFSRSRPASRAGRIADWVFWGVSLVFPVLVLGGFEGLYNHVGKDVLYFLGLPEARWRALFPAPTYEVPNDVFFEVTGILQVVPAAMAGYHLVTQAPFRSRRVPTG